MVIDSILTELYQHQINSREQILGEMLRVKLTQKSIGTRNTDISELYHVMKAETESLLGYFPADRDFFVYLYQALSSLDLVDFACELFKGDRIGTLQAPEYLTNYLSQNIPISGNYNVLITEAEKHLAGLISCISAHPQANFVLTTQLLQMNLLLNLVFAESKNVEIIFESIYSNCFVDRFFDFIICLPAFGGKVDYDKTSTFLTKETDCVAYENMLSHLSQNGTMQIVMPAKITFAGSDVAKLRDMTVKEYSLNSIAILPEGIFRPVTAIKTYLLTVQNKKQGDVCLADFIFEQEKLVLKEHKKILEDHFVSLEDWRVELLLSDEDEDIHRFNQSAIPKVKLKEVVEVFRGKSILKKDTSVGNIAVLNIGNIENGEIHYSDLDEINEEERKVKRYELNDGDIVLSCRGTAIKSALFQAQDKMIIASANVVVIRAGEKMLGGYIRLFLESPVGIALIKSFQRGTTIMNLNHTDIMEMELPFLPLATQQELADRYEAELQQYKQTIHAAENRLAEVKNKLYASLL